MNRKSNFSKKNQLSHGSKNLNKLRICLQGRYLITQVKWVSGPYNIHEGKDLQTHQNIYILSSSYLNKVKKKNQIQQKCMSISINSIVCPYINKSVTFVNECRHQIDIYKRQGILLCDVLRRLSQPNIYTFYLTMQLIVQLLERISKTNLTLQDLCITNLLIKKIQKKNNKEIQSQSQKNQKCYQLIFLNNFIFEGQTQQNQNKSSISNFIFPKNNKINKSTSQKEKSSNQEKNKIIKNVSNSRMVMFMETLRIACKIDYSQFQKQFQTIYWLLKQIRELEHDFTNKASSLQKHSLQNRYDKIFDIFGNLFEEKVQELQKCKIDIQRTIEKIEQSFQKSRKQNLLKDEKSLEKESIIKQQTNNFLNCLSQSSNHQFGQNGQENISCQQFDENYSRIMQKWYQQASNSDIFKYQQQEKNKRNLNRLSQHISQHTFIPKLMSKNHIYL